VSYNGGKPLPPAGNVTLTGYVDDVRPLVARAWASVVPLRIGGGTRLKILEAMALGTPAISIADLRFWIADCSSQRAIQNRPSEIHNAGHGVTVDSPME